VPVLHAPVRAGVRAVHAHTLFFVFGACMVIMVMYRCTSPDLTRLFILYSDPDSLSRLSSSASTPGRTRRLREEHLPAYQLRQAALRPQARHLLPQIGLNLGVGCHLMFDGHEV
jgi:hypothetical protein